MLNTMKALLAVLAIGFLVGRATAQTPPPGPLSKFLTPPEDLLAPKDKDAPKGEIEPAKLSIEIPQVDIAEMKKLADLLVRNQAKMTDLELENYLKAASQAEFAPAKDAKAALAAFLKAHPGSHKAPEILYRLALLEVAAGAKPEATLHRLFSEHYDSVWAKAALRKLTEEELFKVANKLHKEGLAAKDLQQVKGAAAACSLYLEKFTKTNKSHAKELIYKCSDSFRFLGETQTADQALDALRDLAESDPWRQLAELRLAPPNRFQESLDKLHAHDTEDAARVFVEYYERHQAEIAADVADRTRFRYGVALMKVEQKTQAVNVMRGLSKERPKSPAAGDALFWLAEHHYSKSRLAEAQTAYRELAALQPNHPRAKVAAEWANAIDRQAEAITFLEATMTKTFSQWSEKNMQLSARAICRMAGKQRFLCEWAYRDPLHYRFELAVDDFTATLIGNAKSTSLWDRLGPVRISAEPYKLPMPIVRVTCTDDSLFLGWGLSSEERPKFEVDVPGDIAKRFAEDRAREGHVTIGPADKTGKRIILLESAHGDTAVTRTEVALNEAGRIESIRFTTTDAESKDTELIVDRIAFGVDIPLDRFAELRPLGVRIINVNSINGYTLVVPLVDLWSSVSDVLTPQKK